MAAGQVFMMAVGLVVQRQSEGLYDVDAMIAEHEEKEARKARRRSDA